jgi:3-deoxy-manno-octulosonate cytidylyltransferase (CMP-KDO synthetase)
MVAWVWQRTQGARLLDCVLVATDSNEVMDCCRSRHIPAVITSSTHQSGTDRVHEVMERSYLGYNVDDVFVNIQGDEPSVTAEHIELLTRPFREAENASDLLVSTLKVAISGREARNPNDVKVVTDAGGRALYFSRAPIPFDRDGAGEVQYYKHLGLYAYTGTALDRFHSLPQSPLEITEKLEQLRFLENGIPIMVLETATDTIGVDTEEDLARAEAYLRCERGQSP